MYPVTLPSSDNMGSAVTTILAVYGLSLCESGHSEQYYERF